MAANDEGIACYLAKSGKEDGVGGAATRRPIRTVRPRVVKVAPGEIAESVEVAVRQYRIL
jgi:hypothetical protein